MSLRLNRVELILFLVLLATRLIYGAVAVRVDPFLKSAPPYGLYGDAPDYDKAAWRLVSRGEFQLHEKRAPLQPLMMAAVYAVAGHQPRLVRMLQCVLSAGTALLFFYCCRALFGSKAGLWFLALATIHPQLLQISGWLYSENVLLPPLAALAVLHIVGCRKGFSVWTVVGLGVALGLLCLARPTMLPLAPIYVVWLWLRTRHVVAPVAVALATAVVILPWTYRNHNVFGGFVPVAMGGYQFASSNSPNARGVAAPVPRVWMTPKGPVDVQAEADMLPPTTADRLWLVTGLRWMEANPRRALANTGWKYVQTLSPFGYSPEGHRTWSPARLLSLGATGVFLAYLAVCVGMLRQAWPAFHSELAPFVWLAIVTLLAVGITNGAARYLLPLAPYLLMLFCALLVRWRPPERATCSPSP